MTDDSKVTYMSLIKAARESEAKSNQTNDTELQNTGKPEMVNLTIKVSKARRKHWAIEAKKANTSVTQVIIDALINRYGDAD